MSSNTPVHCPLWLPHPAKKFMWVMTYCSTLSSSTSSSCFSFTFCLYTRIPHLSPLYHIFHTSFLNILKSINVKPLFLASIFSLLLLLFFLLLVLFFFLSSVWLLSLFLSFPPHNFLYYNLHPISHNEQDECDLESRVRIISYITKNYYLVKTSRLVSSQETKCIFTFRHISNTCNAIKLLLKTQLQ